MKTDTNKNRSTPKPRSYRKLWISLIAVLALSFLVLGYYGGEIYRKAPPIPKRVVTADGTVLFTAQDIKDGQNVWQSIGGQQLGSIWGHGAYVAPDWSGDWLHREADLSEGSDLWQVVCNLAGRKVLQNASETNLDLDTLVGLEADIEIIHNTDRAADYDYPFVVVSTVESPGQLIRDEVKP